MVTAEIINGILSGRGKSFDHEAVINELVQELEKVNVTESLLPLDRRRSYVNKFHAIGCDSRNLDKNNEVAISRAIFNQKYMSINGELAVFLDYEVSLSKDNKQKLDLLAYKPLTNTLLGIEYKLRPDNSSTGVEYGLLEAFCYGYLLKRYISAKDNVEEEIYGSLTTRLDTGEMEMFRAVNPRRALNIQYVFAAPVTYFSDYLTGGPKAEKRSHRINLMEQKIRHFQSPNLQIEFLGYQLFSEISHTYFAIVDKKEQNISYPYMTYIVSSIVDIKDHMRVIKKVKKNISIK